MTKFKAAVLSTAVSKALEALLDVGALGCCCKRVCVCVLMYVCIALACCCGRVCMNHACVCMDARRYVCIVAVSVWMCRVLVNACMHGKGMLASTDK